jgi:hypothetical protein
MRDRLDEMLRSEADRLTNTLQPRPVREVRARGDQRRRRATAATALLTLAVLAGGGGAAYALARSPGGTSVQPMNHRTPTPAPSPITPARPSGIVGVTSAGALQVLNPATGTSIRTLVPGGVLPEEITVSPNGTVYYATTHGCGTEIYAVPVTGGRSTPVAAGALPAVSPDGKSLAFVQEPYASGGQPAFWRCNSSQPVNSVNLVIRNLATGAQDTFIPPVNGSSALVYPIAHLSWSPDGTRIALSFGEVQDNNGWNLVIFDPSTARSDILMNRIPRTGQVPVRGGNRGFYYREGVYLPNGDLLVNRVCCTGVPVRTTSSLIDEVSTSGTLVKRVAIGFTNRVHSSLDAFGRWALYLSGKDLFVSKNGQPPSLLTSGLMAAAWVPPARS